MPFVLRLYALTHVLYRHSWPEKKETRARDPGVEFFVGASLGGDEAVRKCIGETTGKYIRESKYGRRVLHAAAEENHPQIAKRLLTTCGYFDVNAVAPTGITVRHIAASRGHDDVVEQLLECGADANDPITSRIGRYTCRGRAGSPDAERGYVILTDGETK